MAQQDPTVQSVQSFLSLAQCLKGEMQLQGDTQASLCAWQHTELEVANQVVSSSGGNCMPKQTPLVNSDFVAMGYTVYKDPLAYVNIFCDPLYSLQIVSPPEL